MPLDEVDDGTVSCSLHTQANAVPPNITVPFSNNSCYSPLLPVSSHSSGTSTSLTSGNVAGRSSVRVLWGSSTSIKTSRIPFLLADFLRLR